MALDIRGGRCLRKTAALADDRTLAVDIVLAEAVLAGSLQTEPPALVLAAHTFLKDSLLPV